MSGFPSELTLDRIFAAPPLAGPSLRVPKLAPDGSRVTFLREKEDAADQFDLWEYHVADDATRLLVDARVLVPEERALSEAEKARRERQRIAGHTGIVAYDWAEDGQRLLFPLDGDLFLFDLATGASRRLTDSDGFETDPKLAPDGRHVAFVRDADLFVLDLATSEERALTTDGEGPVSNAMAEFVAQEEMDRDTGYWWSPDGDRIAFLRVDASPVPVTRRYEIDADEVRVVDQRYPYAGGDNVRVGLGVVELASGAVRWLDLGPDDDIYVPRVRWLPDGRRLSFQRQSRDQRRLELLVADVATGAIERWLDERAETFVNLHHDLRFLEDSAAFVWSSERDGFRHLYLHAEGGAMIRPLTAGDWAVDALVGIDEGTGWVYFTAAAASPLEQHLYRQRLTTETPATVERLTTEPGFHHIDMSQDAGVYVDTFSTPDTPPRVSLHEADGRRISWLVENALAAGHPYHPYVAAHRPTRYGTLQAEDGQTLHYRLVLPTGFDPGHRHPVLLHVYGGPHAQMVTRSWSRRLLFEQYLAQQGIVVFALDNRGSARRGTRFENAIHLAMGQVEVADQLRGVAFLADQPWVDPERIAVFGWSYGGYLTLHLLFQHPERFAAGVAVAPVTDWRLYDTHYTERYLGHPASAPDAYERGSVFPHLPNFAGRLLLVHGMADDNVLFSHSTRLMDALQRAGVLFDVMVYPGGKHGISGEASQRHVHATIARFLMQELGVAGPGASAP